MPTPTLKSDDDPDADTESDQETTDMDPDDEETDSTEDEQTDANEEEETAVEEVDLPDDEDDQSEGGLLDGSTFGVSNRALLFLGVSAVLVVLVLRANAAGSQNASRDRYEDEEDVQAELEEGSGGAVAESRDATETRGEARYDEEQQQAAIDTIFG